SRRNFGRGISSKLTTIPGVTKLLALLISFAVCAPAHAVEYLACSGPDVEFEEAVVPIFSWDTDDFAGNGIEWASLAECGQPNYTGATGEAKCVNPAGFGLPNYDTALESDSFNLKGADSAVLFFNLNYQDVGPGLDRLEMQVNSGGGWVTITTWDWDIGAYNGPGVQVAVALNAYLGDGSVRVRWRYSDPTAAPDVGHYVQIDKVRLACIGGADLQASIGADKATVIEGEEVIWTYSFHNDGPKAATNVMGMAAIPAGFNLLDSEISQGLYMPGPGFGLVAMLGTIPSGSAATATIKSRAGIAPEVYLEALTPAALAGGFDAKGSTFGPAVDPASPVEGQVLLADDGAGNPDDGCDPLVNADQMDGNIALMFDGGPCSNDERVKNAQDAGAIAAIVMNDPIFILLPYLPTFLGLADFQVMQPSGNVTEPITIPSIKVGYLTGAALKLNIVNSLTVRLSGVEILSQEQEAWMFTAGEKFDPDFDIFSENTNNLGVGSVIVLKDSDGDGTPDLNDNCPKDAAKLAPAVCGCGIADQDSDSDGVLDCVDLCPDDGSKTDPGVCGCGLSDLDENSNGVIDCQVPADVKALIEKLKTLTGQLKKAKGKKMGKKKKAQQKALKAQIAALSDMLFPLINASSTSLVYADATLDMAALITRTEKSIAKAAKGKGRKYGAKKKKAIRNLNRLYAQIVG
ncbi:hypothetical protein OAO01_08300, partial [Oligoflexia bacterium]|nr:hypothetical protein [Oligoflexia bacterium]